MTPRKNESANSPRANVRLSAPPCAFAILVVEDDPDFLELLLRQISKISGANISVAHNRDEAVELLTNRSFQLVVCDWALAAHTAPEVFRLADPLMLTLEEDSEQKIPVMFMSGSEKVTPTQNLRSLKHFEPVTFILKNLGPPMIRIMAENILQRFNDQKDEVTCVYLS